MSYTRSNRKSSLVHAARKYFVSAFVVFSFAAYAIHERSAGTDLSMALPTPTLTQSRQNRLDVPPSTQPLPDSGQTGQQNSGLSQSSGMYRDGVYTGQNVNAFFGIVQVKAVIQGGKITDVQFVNYPHDRRTSVFINSQAIPWLTQEAIQAQSAQVDIISGATLTSRAFIESLQSALNEAGA
jgi:uncharacterized protein with FMN-binding domain